MNVYDIGDRIRLTGAFTNAGSAVDPSTVTCVVLLPDGTETTTSAVKDSTGNYHADFDVTLLGVHYYRWAGSGAAIAAEENSFVVRPRSVS